MDVDFRIIHAAFITTLALKYPLLIVVGVSINTNKIRYLDFIVV